MLLPVCRKQRFCYSDFVIAARFSQYCVSWRSRSALGSASAHWSPRVARHTASRAFQELQAPTAAESSATLKSFEQQHEQAVRSERDPIEQRMNTAVLFTRGVHHTVVESSNGSASCNSGFGHQIRRATQYRVSACFFALNLVGAIGALIRPLLHPDDTRDLSGSAPSNVTACHARSRWSYVSCSRSGPLLEDNSST